MILFFLKMALQMQISYFSPELKFPPFSLISRSRPFFALPSLDFGPSASSLHLLKTSPRPAFKSNWIISSSWSSPFGSILNLRVPVNNVESYGMMVMCSLTSSSFMLLMFRPSISILPDSNSTILVKARLIVLFPAPVRPTIPILWPAEISKDNFLSTKSVFGLYLSSTSLKVILPKAGHDCWFWYSKSSGFAFKFSYGISMILKHLLIETILVSTRLIIYKNMCVNPWS